MGRFVTAPTHQLPNSAMTGRRLHATARTVHQRRNPSAPGQKAN